MDSTGFVTKVLGAMPLPNNYDIGDGLNTAGYRWVRREQNGNEGIFALDAAGLSRPDNLARKQINFKLDHNSPLANTLDLLNYNTAFPGNASLPPIPSGVNGAVLRVSETKTLQFRVDIMNVFNHPEPNVSTAANSAIMNINTANFGLITGAEAKTNQHRQVQAQLRLNF